MPAARAASSRLVPSSALASTSSRLLTRPSRSRRASARSSAGVRPVAIGTATMAQAPGLLSLPGQLAGRRRRSRLPVAGITPFLPHRAGPGRAPVLAVASHNLADFLRSLALPDPIAQWSLDTLREKLVKIGAQIVRHGRYHVFQLAEVAAPRALFAAILRRIDRLRG